MTIRCVLCLNRSTRYWISTYTQQTQYFNKGNPFSSQLRLLTSQSRQPVLDFEYLGDPKNHEEIKNNVKSRKGHGSIEKVMELLSKIKSLEGETEEKMQLKEKLTAEALKLPNRSDPRLYAYGDTPRIVESPGQKQEFSFRPLQFHEIAAKLDILRTENLGNLTGPRSYYFIKELAQLEQALIGFTVDALLKKGFVLYSVPDLLNSSLIESCGMDTKSERTQVHSLDVENLT